MATMKTLNGYGFNATEFNGKTSDSYLLKTDTAANSADSQKLGGKAPEYYVQPRNLLDNSDFTNPVNQRGITTTDSSFTDYMLDRWIVQNSGTLVTLDSNGLNVAASSGVRYLFQRLNNVKNGKTYTFAAALSNGTIGVCAFTLSSTTSRWEWIKEVHVSSSFQIGVAHSDWIPLFVAMSNLTDTSVRIIWAALYEGSYTADTLPPYVPKGYAAELAECQRYCYAISIENAALSFHGYFHSTTEARLTIPIGTRMRVNPTIVFGDISKIRIYGDGAAVIPSEAAIGVVSGNAVTVTLRGFNNGVVGEAVAKINTTFIISADL